MRVLKQNPVLRLVNSYLVDSPQPINISYLWNFGSLLALCLGFQIVTGVFLVMHYTFFLETFNNILIWSSDIFLTIFQFEASNNLIDHDLNFSVLTSISPWLIVGLIDAEYSSYVAELSSTSIVIWGTNLASNVGYPKFSPSIASIIKLPFLIESFIFGIILSDGWITFSSKASKNARLGFKQSLAHYPYLYYVFNILSHYCSSYPHPVIGKRNNTITFGLQFFTRSLPCFTTIYYLWYVQGIKIVPYNIYDYFTPIALAQWIMGDGSKQPSGLELCTDSYSIQDVVRLINVLIIRYGLICSLRERRKGQYRIYISAKSMANLRSIVEPFIIPSMLYKIHL